MPVSSMKLTLQDLNTLARGTRYSIKFYVERTDAIPLSHAIQGHGFNLYRGHYSIPKLHWDIFIAASIIVLFISGFAVCVTVKFSKRKDVDVELTQLSQETTLQDVPNAIKNENYTHMLPWQPPRDVSEPHPNDDVDNSRLLQQDIS